MRSLIKINKRYIPHPIIASVSPPFSLSLFNIVRSGEVGVDVMIAGAWCALKIYNEASRQFIYYCDKKECLRNYNYNLNILPRLCFLLVKYALGAIRLLWCL